MPADEPQAALIGRDILSAGGSAADAAIAMYFRDGGDAAFQASIGGGGMCVSFNAMTERSSSPGFPSAPVVAGSNPDADRPIAIPGNIRGFFALHGVYGRLRWSQLLAPAENLARFGVPVSRALSNDLMQVESALAREPQMRRIFSAEGGRRMVVEGDHAGAARLAGGPRQRANLGSGRPLLRTALRAVPAGRAGGGGSLSRGISPITSRSGASR